MGKRAAALIINSTMKNYYEELKKYYKEDDIYFYPSGAYSTEGVIEVWENDSPIFLDNTFDAMTKLNELKRSKNADNG